MYYKSREEWLNSPWDLDEQEIYFGIYVDCNNRVKPFVTTVKEDIPANYIIVKRDKTTITEAKECASKLLTNTDQYSSKIEYIKYTQSCKTYYYGVYKTTKGKITTFVCRSEYKAPCNVIKIKCDNVTASIANQLAEELKASLRNDTCTFCKGDVVIHADGDGQHTALVLYKGEGSSSLLFVTSNPLWNKKARVLTKNENILLGYPLKGYVSYFAPVIRDNKDIVKTGKSFPLYRVKELIMEFKIK